MIKRLISLLYLFSLVIALRGEEIPSWAKGLKGPQLIPIIKNQIDVPNPIDESSVPSKLIEIETYAGKVLNRFTKSDFTITDIEEGKAGALKVFPDEWLYQGGASVPDYVKRDLHGMFLCDKEVIDFLIPSFVPGYPTKDLPDGMKTDKVGLYGEVKAGTDSRDAGVWEYPDPYKGELARAFLYVMVSYKQAMFYGGENAVDPFAPDYLIPEVARMVLEWNDAYPPSQREKERNALIKKIQGNSNPFIEYPALVSMVWDENFTEPGTGTGGITGPGDSQGEPDDNPGDNQGDTPGVEEPGVEDNVPGGDNDPDKDDKEEGELKAVYESGEGWIYLSSRYIPRSVSWKIDGKEYDGTRISVSSLDKGFHELEFHNAQKKGKIIIEIR